MRFAFANHEPRGGVKMIGFHHRVSDRHEQPASRKAFGQHDHLYLRKIDLPRHDPAQSIERCIKIRAGGGVDLMIGIGGFAGFRAAIFSDLRNQRGYLNLIALSQIHAKHDHICVIFNLAIFFAARKKQGEREDDYECEFAHELRPSFLFCSISAHAISIAPDAG